LTADTLKGHDYTVVQALVRTIVKEFPRQQLQDSAAQYAYSDLIIALTRVAIDTFDSASLARTASLHTGYPYYYQQAATPADQMIGMVKFCFEVGAKSQCQRLLLRFVPPPNGSNVAQHVSKVLAPFMPVLRQYLISQRLDFQTEPYKMFAGAVVKAFAEKVMVQKPTEVVPIASLQKIGCQVCSDCQQLKAFFMSDQTTFSISRKQQQRTHMERYLAATRAWGVSWVTVKNRTPHTLMVCCPLQVPV
jgi:hypothetical protein